MDKLTHPDHGQILNIIYLALDKINEGLPENEKFVKSPHTYLLGDRGFLDSLGLVTLIVAIEQKINDEYGVFIALAQQQMYAQATSPFETVQSLVDYITILLKNSSNVNSGT